MKISTRTWAVLGLLLLFLAFLWIAVPRFYTVENWTNIARQMSGNAILAAGMTLVILTAGIDLSVGSVVAFSGILTGIFIVRWGLPVPVGLCAGVCAGAGLGAVNGAFVAWARLPPFIVTLAMMVMARSATRIVSDNMSISPFPDSFLVLGQGSLIVLPEPLLLKIPLPVVLMFVVYGLVFLLLRRHRLGRYIYAVGGNEEAARLSGVNTAGVKLFVYTIAGMLAGVVGVFETAQVNAASPRSGLMYELDAIAAVVVGGSSLMGGRGHILGTLLGALLIAVLVNAMQLGGLFDDYQGLVTGAVILFAVLASGRK